ncbi:DUF4194 domain-containing protein [Aliikangiella sp. IMCC44632]
MQLNEFLAQQLDELGVSISEFQELVVRLLNYSVIVRSESHTEQQLFDRLLRCKELVAEYLDIMGIQIYIDSQFEYVRVYPPASEIPGVQEAQENAWSGSLRQRLSQMEVALVLIIRTQYEKALREGKIDEQGYALDSVESLTIAFKNLLGRGLPEKLTERRKLFQRLRQLRLIEYRADEAFESGDSWIKIHPMIVTFVSNPAIAALQTIMSDQTPDELEEKSDQNISERIDQKLANETQVSNKRDEDFTCS